MMNKKHPSIGTILNTLTQRNNFFSRIFFAINSRILAFLTTSINSPQLKKVYKGSAGVGSLWESKWHLEK